MLRVLLIAGLIIFFAVVAGKNHRAGALDITLFSIKIYDNSAASHLIRAVMNYRLPGHLHGVLDFVEHRALSGRPAPALRHFDVAQSDDFLDVAELLAVNHLERLADQRGSALDRVDRARE